jgi:hypothetical protein
VSGIDDSDDDSGTRDAGVVGPVGRKGEFKPGGLAGEGAELSEGSRGESVGRDGSAALGLPSDPARWAGAVTPGITSSGLTGDEEEGVAGLGAVEPVPAGGCAAFGGSGALTWGRSGSEEGASSGGGSWAMARLVP